MEALAQPPISFVRGFAHQGFYLYCHQAPRNRAARAAAWVRLPRQGMNGNSRKSLRRLGARRMAARWVQGHSRRCLAFGLSMMTSRDCEDCRGGRRMCNPRKKPQGRQTQRWLSFGNAYAVVSRTAYYAQCDKSSHCARRIWCYCASFRPGAMYSQGSFPLGGMGKAFTSSMHEMSAADCPPPAPPSPLEDDVDDELAPLDVELAELVFCGVSSEQPQKQPTAMVSKSQRFMTAPFMLSNEPRFRHWP